MKKLIVILRYLLTIYFITIGIKHFTDTPFFVGIMPPFIPWKLELVYISGVLEIVLGALLLIPRFTRLAAWGMVVMMVVIFPANIHMAIDPGAYPHISPTLLYLRLPIQALFIVWAYLFTRASFANNQTNLF